MNMDDRIFGYVGLGIVLYQASQGPLSAILKDFTKY